MGLPVVHPQALDGEVTVGPCMPVTHQWLQTLVTRMPCPGIEQAPDGHLSAVGLHLGGQRYELHTVQRLAVKDVRHLAGPRAFPEKGLVLSLRLEGPAGAGPRVVERLPEDLDALVGRIPAIVRKLFP